MTAKEQIGKLQTLLERVQMRAQVERGAATFAATPIPQSIQVEHDSLPPTSASPDTANGEGAAAAAHEYPNAHDDVDVEVSSETVEVDIDIDEPMPMESGAQPVAQATMPPDDLEDDDAQSTTPPPAHEEVTQMAPANEIEEPAPSSSRRPIAGEEAAEAYGDESSPRHTPPPESGKQVAAPSVHPAARGSEPSFDSLDVEDSRAEEARASLNPSAPPPSLEGHTLVGGWREPGLGPQIGGPPAAGLPAGLTTGVRVPAPPAAAAAPAAQPSGTRLSPDVTRPEVAATAAVGRFEGAPAVVAPTTMGELLDLTLSL